MLQHHYDQERMPAIDGTTNLSNTVKSNQTMPTSRHIWPSIKCFVQYFLHFTQLWTQTVKHSVPTYPYKYFIFEKLFV